MSKSRLIKSAIDLVRKDGNAGKISKTSEGAIAKRLGMGEFSLPTTLNFMAQSSLLAGYVLYDIYGADNEIVQAMAAEHPEIAQMMSRFEPESKGALSMMKIDDYADEFRDIADVIASVGSLDAVLRLRRVMGFSEDTFLAYNRFVDVARSVRGVR